MAGTVFLSTFQLAARFTGKFAFAARPDEMRKHYSCLI